MACMCSTDDEKKIKEKLNWWWVEDDNIHVCNEELFRMKFSTEREVLDFLESWAKHGHTTWRVARTNQCQSAAEGPHEKHTNCPAKMMVLLCTFHILQTFWRYVWNNENNVQKNDKNMIFQAFKRMVYSTSENEFEKNYELFFGTVKYPKILKYVSDMCMYKESWALHCRQNLMIRGNNTNNYCESTMRILKDKIFHRKKAYNIIQLIDFILTRVDTYYEKRMLDVAIKKDLVLQSRYSLESYKDLDDLEITKIDDDTFIVYNTKKKTTYWINMDLEQCTCPIGLNSAPCKHQNIVLKKNPNLRSKNFYSPTEDQRKLLHFLATGDENFPKKFYLSFGELEAEINNQAMTSSNLDVNIQDNEHVTFGTDIVETSISTNLECAVYKTNTIAANTPEDTIQNNERFKNINLELTKFAEIVKNTAKTPDGLVACEKFFKNFKQNSRTTAALYTFLHQCGQGRAKVSKSNVTCQSTSIQRRKSKVGGISRIQSGRPLKKTRKDHHYSGTSKKKAAALHCLSERVLNNIA